MLVAKRLKRNISNNSCTFLHRPQGGTRSPSTVKKRDLDGKFCFHCWEAGLGSQSEMRNKKNKTKQNRAVVDPEGHCHSGAEPGSGRGSRPSSHPGYTSQGERPLSQARGGT